MNGLSKIFDKIQPEINSCQKDFDISDSQQICRRLSGLREPLYLYLSEEKIRCCLHADPLAQVGKMV